MLGWDRYGFDKKRSRTRYVKLVFLHLVGVVGRIVHSSVQNIDALFFILVWDRYGFDKNTLGHVTPSLWFCIPWNLRGHVVHSSESGP
jgi:hypothetical protein